MSHNLGNTLEFWFEFASTYSYPAAMRIEALAEERAVTIAWRPFLLGPIFNSQGWETSPFNIYPAKGRYMWRDMERTCERYGIAFSKPTEMPRNGLVAARIACCFSEAAWLPAFAKRVYAANFAEDRDIAMTTTLSACLDATGVSDAGLSTDDVLSAAQSDANKLKLREQTERARELGIFGAPSFVVDEELFWGHDRLEEALAWASRPR